MPTSKITDNDLRDDPNPDAPPLGASPLYLKILPVMSTNDRALLDGILSSRRAGIAPDMEEDKFFELFLAEQLLWTRNLSWEELFDGVIGGGGDGGIDAIYIFYNGILLASDALPPESRDTASFELFVIQAKRTTGFNETPVSKLREALSSLLDFER